MTTDLGTYTAWAQGRRYNRDPGALFSFDHGDEEHEAVLWENLFDLVRTAWPGAGEWWEDPLEERMRQKVYIYTNTEALQTWNQAQIEVQASAWMRHLEEPLDALEEAHDLPASARRDLNTHLERALRVGLSTWANRTYRCSGALLLDGAFWTVLTTSHPLVSCDSVTDEARAAASAIGLRVRHAGRKKGQQRCERCGARYPR